MTLAEQCPQEVRDLVRDLYTAVANAYLVTPPKPTPEFDAKEKAFFKVWRGLTDAGFFD
jgi:hypothetical protein